MNALSKILFVLTAVVILQPNVFSQSGIEAGDPPNNTDIPSFFKSKLSDIENEVQNVTKGEVKVVAISPGGLPVYAIYYGEKENLNSQANYNSAVAARNPAFYAQKDSAAKPVVFFIGPVHGHEVENIVGMVNLILVAETGKDYRGKDWSDLQDKIEQCRVIIMPCGNPDGRKRNPYDSYVGIPTRIMTKYGQGTRKDGTFWGWPAAKSVHPMKGNVGILGAYFNDDGINPMQDEYFNPMADETSAILEITRTEAPDISVSLHSHEYEPMILQPSYIAMFMKERVHDLAVSLNERYKNAGLPFVPNQYVWKLQVDDPDFPPNVTFNLISALHHISGTMPFTFECSHGSVSDNPRAPKISYDEILDIELILFDEMLDYILENKLTWEVKK